MRTFSRWFLFASILAGLATPALSQLPRTLSDNSGRIADVNRSIEEERKKIDDCATQQVQMAADSAATAKKADARIDSMGAAMQELEAQVEQEQASVSALKGELAVLEAARNTEEKERRSAAGRSHAAIAQSDPEIAANEKAVQAAAGAFERARADSLALVKKIERESARLTDSLGQLEKAIARFNRAIDSLAAAKKTLIQDSALHRKADDDSLAAALVRLAAVHRVLAHDDSVVRRATEKLNTLKQDSITAVTENRSAIENRLEKTKPIDSIVADIQDRKTKLLRVKDKFLLDSTIETLAAELKAAAKSGTAPDPEKQGLLDDFRRKMETVMRDKAFAATITGLGPEGWQKQQMKINGQLALLQKTLDSASEAGQQIVRDGMVVDKQFLEEQKKRTEERKKLDGFIPRAWREVINKKPLLAKAEKDSAVAAKRCESASATFRKKQADIVAQAAAAAAGADSMAQAVEGLKKHIVEREITRKRQLDSIVIVLDAAARELQQNRAGLDAVKKQRQTGVNDSITVDIEYGERLEKARQTVAVKTDEIREKVDRISQLSARLAQTKKDSGAQVSENQLLQTRYKEQRTDLARRIKAGEQAVAALERDRAKLEKEQRAFELEAEAAAESERQEQLAAKREKDVTTERAREQKTKEEKTPAPVGRQAPAKKSPAEIAESFMLKIYSRIESEDIDGALRDFTVQKPFLKQYLSPDVFESLSQAIEIIRPFSTPAEELRGKVAK